MTKQLDKLAQEATAPPEGTVPVPLGDAILDVKPTTEWRSSGIAAMNAGNFEVWASTCLTDDAYVAWREIDPTLAEIKVFLSDYNALAREDLGKSSASPRSSRSTARR